MPNVRRVETPDGARHYGQPIGSIITKDKYQKLGPVPGKAAPAKKATGGGGSKPPGKPRTPAAAGTPEPSKPGVKIPADAAPPKVARTKMPVVSTLPDGKLQFATASGHVFTLPPNAQVYAAPDSDVDQYYVLLPRPVATAKRGGPEDKRSGTWHIIDAGASRPRPAVKTEPASAEGLKSYGIIKPLRVAPGPGAKKAAPATAPTPTPATTPTPAVAETDTPGEKVPDGGDAQPADAGGNADTGSPAVDYKNLTPDQRRDAFRSLRAEAGADPLWGSRSVGRATGEDGGVGPLLSPHAQAIREPSDAVREAYAAMGIDAADMVELKQTPEAAQAFFNAITQGKANNPAGAAVFVYPAEDYQKMRLLLTKDGSAGVAVKADGDIVSVFADPTAPGKPRVALASLIPAAIDSGGTKLDAFDEYLPTAYGQFGLRATSRLAWDPDEAPEDWPDDTTPDVVFMRLDPSSDRYKPGDGEMVEKYDDAIALQAGRPRAPKADPTPEPTPDPDPAPEPDPEPTPTPEPPKAETPKPKKTPLYVSKTKAQKDRETSKAAQFKVGTRLASEQQLADAPAGTTIGVGPDTNQKLYIKGRDGSWTRDYSGRKFQATDVLAQAAAGQVEVRGLPGDRNPSARKIPNDDTASIKLDSLGWTSKGTYTEAEIQAVLDILNDPARAKSNKIREFISLGSPEMGREDWDAFFASQKRGTKREKAAKLLQFKLESIQRAKRIGDGPPTVGTKKVAPKRASSEPLRPGRYSYPNGRGAYLLVEEDGDGWYVNAKGARRRMGAKQLRSNFDRGMSDFTETPSAPTVPTSVPGRRAVPDLDVPDPSPNPDTDTALVGDPLDLPVTAKVVPGAPGDSGAVDVPASEIQADDIVIHRGRTGELESARVVSVSDDAGRLTWEIEYADGSTETVIQDRSELVSKAPAGEAVLDPRVAAPVEPDVTPPAPLPASTAGVRPALYTYQRKNIVALGLTEHADDDVAEGARRLVARQPMSGAQATALARAIQELSDGEQKAVRKRSLARAAQAMDAAGMRLGQPRSLPDDLPNADKVTKTKIEDFTEGDTIVFTDAGGALVQGKITAARSMMSGRLYSVTVENPDGTTTQRLFNKGTEAFLLPDLPTPVRTAIYGTPKSRRRKPAIYVSKTKAQKDREAARTATGETPDPAPAAETPPAPAAVAPVPEAPTEPAPFEERDISYDEVLDGDRIQIKIGSGYTSTGEVFQSENIDGEPADDGTVVKGRELSMFTDNGEIDTVRVYDTDPPGRIRLLARDEAAAERIKTAMREQEISRRTREITRLLNRRAAEVAEQVRAIVPTGATRDQAVASLRGVLDDPTDMRFRSSRSDTAFQAVQSMTTHRLPNDQIRAISTEVTKLADQASRERAQRILAAWEDMREDADPADVSWVISVSGGSMPPADYSAAARTLALAAEGLTPDADTVTSDRTKVAGEALPERIASYRDELPDDMSQLGRATFRVSTFSDLDLEKLTAGEVPEITEVEVTRPDFAADGGYGVEAMRQLQVILDAGGEIQDRVNDAIREELKDKLDGDPIEVEQASLRTESEADKKFRAEYAREDREIQTGQRDLARQFGYKTYASLTRAANSSRTPDEKRTAIRQAVRELEATPAVRRQSTRISQLALEVARERSIKIRSDIATARANALQKVLQDIRPLGGEGLVYNGVSEKSGAVKGLRYAEARYPTEWLDTLREGGAYTVGVSRRGSHSAQARRLLIRAEPSVVVNAPPSGANALHELGHAMEYNVPGLLAAEGMFLYRRTSEGEIGSRTRSGRNASSSIYPWKKVDEEFGRPDDFLDHYTGKEYDGRAFEIFTTGIESVYAGSRFADEDMERFIFGALALLGNRDRDQAGAAGVVASTPGVGSDGAPAASGPAA